ncbi:MAG TPA: EAL domain-containing protein [Burkholderiales bacterium]|nr:EAL domain-containing protein [Burkholderiales bacterium]
MTQHPFAPPSLATSGSPGPSPAELLSQALDAIPAYVSFVDSELRYRWVNKHYEDWYGMPRERIIGCALRDLMDPEQFAVTEPHARRALAGETVHYEVEVHTPAGSRFFEVSYLPSPTAKGFHVLSVDRTEERRTELAKEESEQRYSTVVSHLPGAVYRTRLGESWTTEYVSDGIEDLTGYPGTAFLGPSPARKFADLILPEDRSRVSAEIEAAAKAGRAYSVEYRIRHRDGSVRWVHDSGQPAGGADGAGTWVEGVGVDITDHKRAEQALRESEARFRALVESVPDLIFLLSEDGVFLDCHAAREEQLVLPREQFLGRKVTEVFEHTLADRFRRAIAESCAGKRLVQIEYPLEFGGEKRQFECRIVPCGARRLLGIVRDVTDRARRDEALRRVAEGVSAATGAEFFRSVVVHLAGVLQADYVLVGTVSAEQPGRVRTLAAVGHGEPMEAFDYELRGTPCEHVVTQNLCAFAAGVRERFPGDRVLAGMGAEAYVGTPLLDSAGRPLGLIAAVWTKRLEHTDFAEALMRIFAARAAAELERLRAEESLRLAARVFDTAAEGIIVLDAQERILSVNRAFCEISGYSREEVIGESASILRPGLQGESFFKDVARSLAESSQWQGEMWNRRKDGTPLPSWVSVSAVRDQAGEVVNLVCILNDISSLKESQQRLEQLANHDSLTGLPNRNLLQDRVTHGMDKARRNRERLALLYLDLDNFKIVNDTLGHDAGDRLLVQVAARLRECARDRDTVARLGGDEFVVVLDEVADPQQVARMADRVAEHFREPFTIEGQQQVVSFSLGIALYPDDGNDLASLLRNADLALYRAKEYGRSCYRFFTEDMNVQAFERKFMEAGLQRALERAELAVHYQPVVELASGRITAVEALLHWQHPDMGLLQSSRFLPAAEKSGLIIPVGTWSLNAAFRRAAAWSKEGLTGIRMVVNLSARQLQDPGIVRVVREALAESGVLPDRIELDLPESVVARDPAETIATIELLRKLGVRLCVDNFGVGPCSLALLRRLPIDGLKIDRSLVRDFPANPGNAAIVRGIISLARAYDLEVTAEGVETPAQREALLAAGCDFAQGYLYSTALADPQMTRALSWGTLAPSFLARMFPGNVPSTVGSA